MNLIRNNTFNNEIILIDGLPRSGKTIISKILECYDNIEKSKEDEPFQITQHLYRLGKIDKNTAVTLMRIWADRYLYNQMIGRNINMNTSDITSLFKNPFPEKYLKRMATMPNNDLVIKEIKDKNIIFQNMSQHAMIESDIYFDAFGDRLKIIYIDRDEEDLIDAIMERGLGNRLGEDPTDVGLTIDYKGNSIPYYAVDWPNEYINSTPLERVTKWIIEEKRIMMEMYNRLDDSRKKQILFIKFENIVTNPIEYCKIISRFIDRDVNANILKNILSKEDCPRKL